MKISGRFSRQISGPANFNETMGRDGIEPSTSGLRDARHAPAGRVPAKRQDRGSGIIFVNQYVIGRRPSLTRRRAGSSGRGRLAFSVGSPGKAEIGRAHV